MKWLNQFSRELKGCAHYLNRCTTSPRYILYQFNDILPKVLLFLKKALASSPRTFHIPRYIYQIYNGTIEASRVSGSFQIAWRIGIPNKSRFQLYNYYPLYWNYKFSTQVYFIDIRLLFSRIFYENRFYSFIQIFLHGAMIKILYFW